MCPGAEEREAVLLENEYGFQMSRVSVPGASSMAEIAGNEVRLLQRTFVKNFCQELVCSYITLLFSLAAYNVV
jgi:hypothetical protein